MNSDSSQIRQSPFVSIVMPCFNSAEYIDSTLRSISEQLYIDYELIVVDDGSTDDTLLKVELWRARLPSLNVVNLAQNSGPGNARNKGIEAARADLVALIDSDDVWFKDKLELQVSVHTATNCGFSCTAFKFGETEIFQLGTDYTSLLKNNVINTSSVMFDRSQIDFKFQSERKSEDYVAWLQISKIAKIQFINKVLVERRKIEGVSANKLQMARRRWVIYRQTEGLCFFAAAYYFSYYMVSGIFKHYRS